MVHEAVGRKIPDVVMRDQWEGEWDALENFAYEMTHYFEFDRSVNPWEARTLASEFFRNWLITHPEEELRYVEIKDISRGEAMRLGIYTEKPLYEFKTQLIHHSPAITLAAIAAAIAAVAAWVGAHIVMIGKIVAVYLILYGLWRGINYIIPGGYKCPKCGEEFNSWSNFVIHFRTVHPDQQVPPKPREWMDYFALALIAIGGAITFRIAYPAIRGKGKG